MGNSYFQFKQFTIQQGKTAMKVCTDACLFGAFIAKNIAVKRVLDIGAGTGLLSMMYAQKNTETIIEAIEVEENAYEQAKENIAASPWDKNVIVHHIGLQQYQPIIQYDLILSNPPFFDNDLQSDNVERNVAMHSTRLSLAEIFAFAEKYLNVDGKLALLLPFHRTADVEINATKNGFLIANKLLVRQTPNHDFFRTIFIFSKNQSNSLVEEITIKDERNQYTHSFVELLKDYYLFL